MLKKNAFWPNVLLFQKQKAQSRSGKIKFKKTQKTSVQFSNQNDTTAVVVWG